MTGQCAGLPERVDAVVHIAALSAMPNIDTDALLASNVAGTRNMVKYALAAGVRRFIYASSLSIHGRIASHTVTSTTPVVDPDIYGATKYLGERLIAEAADRVPAIAIRLPGVLGRGAHRAWIPTLLARIQAGQQIAVFNPDAPFNNAADIDDVGRFVVDLLQVDLKGFEAVPIGAAGQIRVRDVPDILMAAAGRRVPVGIRTAPQSSFIISSEEAISRFGYAPMEIGAMLRKYASG